MMQLTDMRTTAEERKELMTESMPTPPVNEDNGPKYPYGLEICLGPDAMSKLGFAAPDFAAGDIVVVQANAVVTRVSEEEDQTMKGSVKQSMNLQLTDIGVEKPSMRVESPLDEEDVVDNKQAKRDDKIRMLRLMRRQVANRM